jgi:hypothetical protein
VKPLAVQRVGVDVPRPAARLGRDAPQLTGRPHEAERYGPEQRRFRAAGRQVDANARGVLDHASADLDQALSDRCELGAGERARPRDRGAHAVHQPERGGVENEPHLIGRRAVARHAVGGELRLVQLDQVLHLPALAIDVLVKVLRRAFERGDDVADVDLLAHAG